MFQQCSQNITSFVHKNDLTIMNQEMWVMLIVDTDELFDFFGLTGEHIAKKVEDFVHQKSQYHRDY